MDDPKSKVPREIEEMMTPEQLKALFAETANILPMTSLVEKLYARLTTMDTRIEQKANSKMVDLEQRMDSKLEEVWKIAQAAWDAAS